MAYECSWWQHAVLSVSVAVVFAVVFAAVYLALADKRLLAVIYFRFIVEGYNVYSRSSSHYSLFVQVSRIKGDFSVFNK